MTPALVEKMETLFTILDEDKSGTLEKEEVIERF